MRRLIVFVLTFCLLLNCTACNLNLPNTEKQTIPNETSAFSIQTIVDKETYPASSIAYPQLHSNSLNFIATNLLIKETLMCILDKVFADSNENSSVVLEYSASFENEKYFCVLFEGAVLNKNAAHPTNLGFPICISLLENRILDPTSLFALDDNFIAAFREELLNNQSTTRFDDEQWKNVETYIGSFSNNEILEIISANPAKTFSLQNNGVIVLFPVPHTLGDYVKIFVKDRGRFSVLTN